MMPLTTAQRLKNVTAQLALVKAERDACLARPRLRGRKDWGPEVERWRSLVAWCADKYALKYLNRLATDYEVDMFCGVVWGESRGDPNAVCKVEWIGPEPPGYDADNPATRASGLVAQVPAFFPGRAVHAGFPADANIFDPLINLSVAAWLIFNKPAKAPNWQHWPDAPNGAHGSATKAQELLASLYSDAERA
jgi:hypothetical protein